jgi:hypothetical protein
MSRANSPQTKENEMKRMLILTAAALLCTACLERETTHTVYLEPDGSVSWEILERGVRSSEEDPGSARNEQAEYLQAATAAAHDLALGLESLGSRPVTTVLRDRPPFTVHTRAWFPSAAALTTALEAELAGALDVRITRDCDETLVEIKPPADGEWESTNDSPALALLLNADEVRVVLGAGRYLDATGFDIVGEQLAILGDGEDTERLELRWTESVEGAR